MDLQTGVLSIVLVTSLRYQYDVILLWQHIYDVIGKQAYAMIRQIFSDTDYKLKFLQQKLPIFSNKWFFASHLISYYQKSKGTDRSRIEETEKTKNKKKKKKKKEK